VTISPILESITNFPMGPKLRTWFQVPDTSYRGHDNTSPTADDIANFTDAVLKHLQEFSPRDADHLVDLIEELVGMNLPLLAIKMVEAFPEIFPSEDFRAQLHYGNASMLVGDLARAQLAFISAQQIVPEEPAPYINLAQIYCHDGMLHEAYTWCLSGIDADANNPRLWELLAWVDKNLSAQEKSNQECGERLAILARKKNSWAGTSLACELINSDDVLSKLAALEKFYDEGLRDEAFLVEFTALLGVTGEYDRIPAILWQAEKQSSQGLCWQLILHLAQAYMGLGRDDEAVQALDKLNKIKDLPEHAQASSKEMLAEITGKARLN